MKTKELSDNDIKHWKTMESFVKENKQFSLSQIQWLMRNRKRNGFEKAVRKIGKRIYINEAIFADCILTNKK